MVLRSMKDQTEKPSIHDFKVKSEIGQGNFSRVCVAVAKSTKEKFALKVIEKQKIHRLKVRHPNVVNEIQMEKAVLNSLRHPNIIPLYHTFQDAQNLYFLMEYLGGGEVWDVIMRDGNQIGVHEEYARFLLADLVSAMVYLKQEGVVHRDLKPENFVISHEDGHARLVDFGTAKNLKDTSLNGPNFVGTPEYMPPETIANKDVDTDSDLWALGCIAYQLLAGETPFHGGSSYLTFLKTQAGRLNIPSFFSENATHLITSLLKQDPKQRLGSGDATLQAIKDHPFFQNIHFESHQKSYRPVASLRYQCLLQIVSILTKHNTSWPFQTLSTLKPRVRAQLMHILDRQQVLQQPAIFKLFFDPPSEYNYHYIQRQGYLGKCQNRQGRWHQDFTFMHISDIQLGRCVGEAQNNGGSCWSFELQKLNQTILAINKVKPTFVVIGGGITFATPHDSYFKAQIDAFKSAINHIDDTISLMFTPGDISVRDALNTETQDAAKLGDEYYSFWHGGLKGIVLHTSLLYSTRPEDAELKAKHQKWLEQELEIGKLCSQHLIVFGYHPCTSTPCATNCIPECVHSQRIAKHTQSNDPSHFDDGNYWTEKMNESKVRYYFTGHTQQQHIEYGNSCSSPLDDDQEMQIVHSGAIGSKLSNYVTCKVQPQQILTTSESF